MPDEHAMKTILIVEDDADLRNMLRLMFDKEYIVLEAADGREAMGIYISESPDLVITDNRMPHLTGLQFSILIQDQRKRRNCPVIMITAFRIDERDVIKANIDAFIEKPFVPSDLKAVVERLIQNGAAQDKTG